jgi:hypothetical protein
MPTILFDRQKRLLGLLSALGGDVGNLDFQKLLFLFCQSQPTPAYEFVPYKFGAFSFSSYADRRKLIERGLVDHDDRSWRLTPEGREVASRLRVGVLEAAAFAHAHRALRGDALVAETYRRFPYFGIRSEIAERILAGDETALAQIARLAPPAVGPGVASIGYEGQSLEGYLNRLIRAGITVPCDVRRNAISRKYGFSKSTLANACASVAIRYEHLPELGIASEQRQGLDQPGVRHALFADYAANLLPHQQPALDRIRGWLTRGESVALTCFERLPKDCHRHCVVDALLPTLGESAQPLHL